MEYWRLLQDYAEHGSEDAFEALVKGHVGMVYATALRRMRDPHSAQDVTQAVFILLARKAAKLKPPVVLAGWLYRTTLHTASQALRDQARLQRREKEAAAMISDESADELWEKLAPYLDTAMSALDPTDRDAVVLRYLQQQNFRQVAAALGMSEDAAKKRVSRAVERLRMYLSARGVSVSVVALGTILAARTVQAVPSDVVAAMASVGAKSNALATATALSLAGHVAREWLFTKLKWATGIAIAISAAILLTVGPGSREATPLAKLAVSPASASTDAPDTQSEASTQTPISEAVVTRNPRAMLLKVVSSPNSSPLTGAVARAVFYGQEYIRGKAMADTNGVIEIVRPAGNYDGMSFWIAASGHVPKSLSWKREEELSLPAEYVVKLDPGVRVAGRVVDEDEQPVAGAEIRFNGDGQKWNARDYVDYRYPLSIPTADGQGEWTADYLDAKPNVSGFVNHPDYAEMEFKFTLEQARGTGVTIVIKRGAPVSGLVLGTDGTVVTNAQVTADWEYSRREEIKANSDAEGRFNLPHVTPGSFRLKISASGYKDSQQWVDLNKEGASLEVALEPRRVAGTATLRGRVLDEEGEPISGVHVSLSYGQPALKDVDWSAQTDKAGRFLWTQAPEGAVRLTFGEREHEQLNDVELAADDSEHTVTMKAVTMKAVETVVVRFQVTDKLSGRLIP